MSSISVVVDDPRSEGFGPTKHTTYRIVCSSTNGGNATARHRFSEFVTLRSGLMDMLPGVVVPPLPEKKMGASGMGLGLGTMAASATSRGPDPSDTVEKRRDGLQLFLQRCADHPIASSCEKLSHFLVWNDALRQTAAGAHAGFVLPPLPSDSAGDSLKDAGALLSAFERQLHATRATLKKLQMRQHDDALDLHEASSGLKEMGENGMNAVLAPALSGVAEGMHTLAGATKRQAENTKAGLLTKLALFKSLAVAIQEQFKRRAAVQAGIDASNGKIKELLGSSTKLAGKPGKEKKVAELEQQAGELQRKVEEARDLYAAYTQTLHWELEQYNKNKNLELIRTLQAHALAHLEFTSRQHEIWGQLSAGITSHVTRVVADPEHEPQRRSSFGDIGTTARRRTISGEGTPPAVGGASTTPGSPTDPDPDPDVDSAGGSLAAMLRSSGSSQSGPTM